jgi:hypothetical protein
MGFTPQEVFIGRVAGSAWIIGNIGRELSNISNKPSPQLSGAYVGANLIALHALWFPGFWWGATGRVLLSPKGWAIAAPVLVGAGISYKIAGKEGLKDYSIFLLSGPTQWPLMVKDSIDIIAEEQSSNPGAYPIPLGIQSKPMTERSSFINTISSTILGGTIGRWI